MLICDNPKFLLVHVQKTGGTSLSVLLKKQFRRAKDFLGTHDHALWARNSLGAAFDSYYKFAFVRNPWDRLVSWHSMIMEQAPKTPAAKLNVFWKCVMENGKVFHDFIRDCTKVVDDKDGRKSAAFNQVDYLTDESGKVIVDFVGRFENFQADATAILAHLGIRRPNLPHVNPSKHGEYRQYYTEETREIVARRFARDIGHFGYEF